MFFKGKHVELLVDVLDDKVLSIEDLCIYRRSGPLKVIHSSQPDVPHTSLRRVPPKFLWDFQGHPSIRSDWFRHMLLYDKGDCDLLINVDVAEDCCRHRDPMVVYLSGELVIQAGLRLVVGEAGLVWSDNASYTLMETVVEWPAVRSVSSRRIG